MARRKPAQAKEAVLLRLPEEDVAQLKDLAAQSFHADGTPMSVNQYCAAVLTNALKSGMMVQESVSYAVTSSVKTSDGDDDAPKYAPRTRKNETTEK